ncbi:MAG TPA: Gfo/Idh/MocA family oxidoreductase [Ktedonobacteraceae bacterium]|jgi:predicted dehydrogenase|nr:Gfo/Idh/MocA family oxidoreductase [Ktedonobacteraceae bacterium]
MTLRLIHAGLGGWGSNWAKEIVARNKDVETVAWVEIVPDALRLAQERLDLPEERCFATLEEALAVYEADAVLVTASLPGHIPVTRAALQAGKHVLLEKPFAPTVEEAREVVELAEKNDRILMISQNYRYFPAVRKVAELVSSQELGPVTAVNIDFRKYDNTQPRETHRHYHIPHPLLMDMTIHHFDLMRLVLGQEPRRVVCTTWNPSWSNYDEPPAGAASITFDQGTIVNYRGSWVSTGEPTSWAGSWHMECEKGEIIWTSRGETPESVSIRRLGEPAENIELPEITATDRHGSLAAFVQAVQTGEEPESSGRRNLYTLALMFATMEAADTGQPVSLDHLR